MILPAKGIVLLYVMSHPADPAWTNAGIEISERVFETKEECAEFVNILGDDGTNSQTVNENFEFQFASNDGYVFTGGCYTVKEVLGKIP